MEGDFENVGEHPNEYVRAWMIRLIGDEQTISESTMESFTRIAQAEMSPAVVAQLACTGAAGFHRNRRATLSSRS